MQKLVLKIVHLWKKGRGLMKRKMTRYKVATLQQMYLLFGRDLAKKMSLKFARE